MTLRRRSVRGLSSSAQFGSAISIWNSLVSGMIRSLKRRGSVSVSKGFVEGIAGWERGKVQQAGPK